MTPSPEALAEVVERLTKLANELEGDIGVEGDLDFYPDRPAQVLAIRLVLDRIAALTDPAMVLVPREPSEDLAT